jgi:hypothetical protein
MRRAAGIELLDVSRQKGNRPLEYLSGDGADKERGK